MNDYISTVHLGLIYIIVFFFLIHFFIIFFKIPLWQKLCVKLHHVIGLAQCMTASFYHILIDPNFTFVLLPQYHFLQSLSTCFTHLIFLYASFFIRSFYGIQSCIMCMLVLKKERSVGKGKYLCASGRQAEVLGRGQERNYCGKDRRDFKDGEQGGRW